VVIGDIDDFSGVYADAAGTGAVEAVKMAIADFGGTVLGRKITSSPRTIRTSLTSVHPSFANGPIRTA